MPTLDHVEPTFDANVARRIAHSAIAREGT
jgi:hypothetical protein